MNPRRLFIGFVLMLAGLGRGSARGGRAWSPRQASGRPSNGPDPYASLARPIRIPLREVTTPWRSVSFIAEATAPATPTGPARRVLVHGVLFRTDTDLSALCVTCPHEQCRVELVTDQARLSRMTSGTATHPLFECGCHFSVFDAAEEGARISGETPRGLYRFRVTAIDDGVVEINEIEEVALFEV
jgi:Rieske Fe-S protein